MPETIDYLKGFLIKRLLLVLLFIICSEAAINLLFTRVASPIFNDHIGVELFLSHQSPIDTLGLLAQFLGYLLCMGLYHVLPSFASAPFLLLANQLSQGNKLFMEGAFSGFQGFLILCLMVTMLLLYLLPYIAGILFYSRTIIHKVEEIRMHDQAQREQFLQKRNLLLSDIAHDLKTPITTIAGYAQALNEGMIPSPEKQKAYLTAIYGKSMQMSQLITLLFDYVKLDSEGFILKTEKTDLTGLLLEITAALYPDMEKAGIELDVDVPEQPGYASVDRAQFSRAVTNLLTNAIRHNETGIRIGLSLELASGIWSVRIADSGGLIAPALEEHLFEPFVMGDKSRSSQTGSGLGLSISSKIISMHGGVLTLEQPAKKPYTKAFLIKIPQLKQEDPYNY